MIGHCPEFSRNSSDNGVAIPGKHHENDPAGVIQRIEFMVENQLPIFPGRSGGCKKYSEGASKMHQTAT
jgi:hypothetical protein